MEIDKVDLFFFNIIETGSSQGIYTQNFLIYAKKINLNQILSDHIDTIKSLGLMN